jgi:hypothetical protein
MIPCLWLKKHIPDVVSVPERKEPPLSIDPSNPSVDMLLSVSWPPASLGSGIETTRWTTLTSDFSEMISSGREKTLIAECRLVDGLSWGNLWGLAAWDTSVFTNEESCAEEWLYAGEIYDGCAVGEKSRESRFTNKGSSGDGASKSASKFKMRDCS